MGRRYQLIRYQLIASTALAVGGSEMEMRQCQWQGCSGNRACSSGNRARSGNRACSTKPGLPTVLGCPCLSGRVPRNRVPTGGLG